MSFEALCGWREDPAGIAAYAKENGNLARVASNLIGGEQRDCYLWLPLRKLKPTWRRGAQGLGSCVAWGMELAATVLMGVESEQGKMQWIEEAATESIYGGCRVEVYGKRNADWSDGATGWGAAQFVKKYGVLLRQDYSKLTGNPEHDLRKYDKTKEKNWGYYGCGGQNDKGKLDELSRQHPIENVTQVKTVPESIAALQNAYPITIASSAGFGNMVRDVNGLCYWVGTWQHQMCVAGIRWRNGKAEFAVFQSWGDCVTGPNPGITDEAINATMWWINEETMSRILRSGDCWTYSGVSGFEPRKLDFLGEMKKWLD